MVTNKQLFFTAAAIIVVMFLYLERSILGSFILAAVFAFILNPVVSLASKYLRFPRVATILIIYLVILVTVGTLLTVVGGRLLAEAKEIANSGTIDQTAQQVINALPNWNIAGQEVGIKASISQLLDSTRVSADTYIKHSGSLVGGLVTNGVSFLVFFVAGFYLLKDWSNINSYIVGLFPEKNREDFREVWNKVKVILGNYLRGQLLLIAIMAVASFVVLETLGIKYALTLAILTGFLEIIPYVGPVVAGTLAAGVAFVIGQNRFGLDPTAAALIVIAAYVILRHLEDYFVIPALYNRLTKVHPLVVIFSVLAGGHLFGVLGLILAVPVAATVKVIFEYFLDRTTLSM